MDLFINQNSSAIGNVVGSSCHLLITIKHTSIHSGLQYFLSWKFKNVNESKGVIPLNWMVTN